MVENGGGSSNIFLSTGEGHVIFILAMGGVMQLLFVEFCIKKITSFVVFHTCFIPLSISSFPFLFLVYDTSHQKLHISRTASVTCQAGQWCDLLVNGLSIRFTASSRDRVPLRTMIFHD